MRTRPPSSLLHLAAILLSLCACDGPNSSDLHDAPNLLLITVDTLRPDHTSAYGYPRDTTPALRKLAERSTRFESAYAPQGVTAPSHATLFTGLHPLGHGLVDNGRVLETQQPLLAERLRDAGYTTGAFVSSYPLKARFGFGRGFDTFDDSFGRDESTVEVDEWQGDEVDGAFDRNARATVDQALDWLDTRTEEGVPFFLWTHLFEPHTPLRPHASVRGAFDSQPLPEHYAPAFAPYANLYDAEILYADQQIARLLDRLRARGLEGSTLIVVTSDHGEGLNQHGWWLHGVSVHESEIRVPLIVHLPGQTEAVVATTPTQLADIVPTLAEWLPLALEENPLAPATASGASVASLLRGQPSGDLQRDLHFFRRYRAPYIVAPMFPTRMNGQPSEPKRIVGEQLGIRRGTWKLLFAEEQREAALYDLESDPRERRNVADQHKELTLELIAEAKRFADAHGRDAARTRTVLPDNDREALEALGYVE